MSLKILFASSEARPLIKTGGLADVSGSLPAALRNAGLDVRLILPGYPQAISKAGAVTVIATLNLPGVREPVHILESYSRYAENHVYLVSAHGYFDRGGNPYTDLTGNEWGDNPERFTMFCRIIAMLAQNQVGINWNADLIHCNDWQTGLTPVMLNETVNVPATIFTIHNLSYQGIFNQATFQRLELKAELWNPNGVEYHGNFSFLKSGIMFANRVNTVSPTYAKEVCTPRLGYGMEGLLNHLGERFSGIINGIDYREWNAATDHYITCNYDINSFELKIANKLALQENFGLPRNEKAIVFGYVGRLVEQKGCDLILAILPQLLANESVQIIIQGSGDIQLEQALKTAMKHYDKQLSVYIGYDEKRAHTIIAGCDSFLMPSRFEPCGLTQLYSLRYGTIPIVHRTGGLQDTVVDATADNVRNGTATGFMFEYPDAAGLWYAIQQALNMYEHEPNMWRNVAITGMKQDFSWNASARKYIELYYQAIMDSKYDYHS